MRDPKRLDAAYSRILEIHKKYYPDMRIGQFWMNFLGYVSSVKKIDPFFPEEERLLGYLEEYCAYDSPYYTGGDLLDDDGK